MATVGIWKISNDLRQVIKYTTNEEKTELSNYKDLEQSLSYIKDEFKTEQKLFVDGINCNPDNALKEMVEVKNKFMKPDGILGFHAYHSFKPGEVTPHQAHEVGLKVANEMWGDRFQVVVSTHLNGKCFHNHYVINSVSFVDGKRYYDNRTNYAELRRLSNAICEEYGLSTLEEKKTKAGLNYANYQNKSLNYINYYKTAKEDLDIAISQSHSYDDFFKIMKNMGYDILNRADKLSIKNESYRRNIRIERYFGEDYTIDNIKKQIQGIYLPLGKSYYKKGINTPGYLNILLKPKYNSFYWMYVRYCNILGNYPNYVKKNYISSNVRNDVNKLEQFSKQAILLANNKIETEDQFIEFNESKISELIKLKNTKEDLWKKSKQASTSEKEEIKLQIQEINKKIKPINEEVKMCENIRVGKDLVKENLKSLKDKEMIIDEHIR